MSPAATMDEIATGRAFGTFGELLQGALPGHDRDFLVTFPLDSWSTATFLYQPGNPEIQVIPATKAKGRRLARLALDRLGHRGGGVLELSSDLPEGKGLASSSADLVATARAVAATFDVVFEPAALESLLRAIEPSDGVMYDGIAAFFHRQVRLHRFLGTLPPLTIIGHDEGGQVDTVRYNRVPKPFTPAEKHEYARLLAEMTDAVASADVHEVGRIATRSATLHARLRPRRGLPELRRASAEIGGLGLVLAHSGTMLGILLESGDAELGAKVEFVRASCAPLGGTIVEHRSLSGDRMVV